MSMKSDIMYIFSVKPEYKYILEDTTCSQKFGGTIEEDLDGQLLVKINSPRNAYVILPKKAILSMAPSKIHSERDRFKYLLSCIEAL